MAKMKRGVLALSKAKPRRVYQNLDAVDQFGELAARKRAAVMTATAKGHQMRGWHRRPNDPFGRWNNYCLDCNALAVVCVEEPTDIHALSYGDALTTECGVPKEEKMDFEPREPEPMALAPDGIFPAVCPRCGGKVLTVRWNGVDYGKRVCYDCMRYVYPAVPTATWNEFDEKLAKMDHFDRLDTLLGRPTYEG